MSNRLKRSLYAWTFYLAVYVLVWWVTHNTWLAVVAGVVTSPIAAQDWDWRQRRKAENAEKAGASDV